MKKWFAANIIDYAVPKNGKPEDYCCSEDVEFILAENYDRALAKTAFQADFRPGDGWQIGDEPAVMKLAGIRQLVECECHHEQPVHGTEITYHEFIVDEDNFNRLKKGNVEFWATTVEQDVKYLKDKADRSLYDDDDMVDDNYEPDYEPDSKLSENKICGAAHLLYYFDPDNGEINRYHIYERVLLVYFEKGDDPDIVADSLGKKFEVDYLNTPHYKKTNMKLKYAGVRTVSWWWGDGREPSDTDTFTYWDYCMESEEDIIRFANGESVRVEYIPLREPEE